MINECLVAENIWDENYRNLKDFYSDSESIFWIDTYDVILQC